MGQTFNDFVAECTAFDHSRENYELMKECAEITLMEQYISDQTFMVENVAELTTNTFTESYFSEAVDAEKITSITEAMEAKKDGLFKKIFEGLKKIWDKFVKFIVKFTTKLISTNVENQKVLAKLKEKELSKKDAGEIAKAINEAMSSNEKYNILPSTTQPFAKEITLKGVTDGINVNALAVAFSNTTAVIAATNGAVSADAMLSIVKGFLKGRKGYEMEATCKKLDVAIKTANANGVEIWANDKKAQKLADRLQEYLKQLNEKAAEIDEDEISAEANAARDCYAKLVRSVGSTISVYSSFLAYRSKVVAAVKTIVG